MRAIVTLTLGLALGLAAFSTPRAHAQWGSAMEDLAPLTERLDVEARSRAQRLAPTAIAPAIPLESEDGFILDVEDFVLKALQLSHAIEAQGGPQDLACIFRGMSGDANTRLEALLNAQTRGDQARFYLDYADLFEVAHEITSDPENQPETSVFSSCPAPEL
ncbi:hypothetical protein [Woodsholea maritima]|uniref:hypothetical protein n=1 Tax=Woodsholea maritima TaxID=240237 RepID=UPI00036DF950|nr:hypothetical protein [Woodsholea maritima]